MQSENGISIYISVDWVMQSENSISIYISVDWVMQSENGILLLFYIFLSHGNGKKTIAIFFFKGGRV